MFFTLHVHREFCILNDIAWASRAQKGKSEIFLRAPPLTADRTRRAGRPVISTSPNSKSPLRPGRPTSPQPRLKAVPEPKSRDPKNQDSQPQAKDHANP